MELIKYYDLNECNNLKVVTKQLNKFKKDGKIVYEIDMDLLKIEDIDLEEDDIQEILSLFDNNDIFPNPDYDDDYYNNYNTYNEDEDY